jgi:hypothetical protein
MAKQLDMSYFVHQAYEDDAMRRTAVSKWWKRFIDEETNVKGQNRLLKYAANDLQHVFDK